MKHAILNSLKKERVVSGEALAQELDISRTAVWKYINQLRGLGYIISSAPRRGYSLQSVPERLLADEILDGLTTRMLGRNIVSLEEVPSTQDHAKILSIKGCPEGTLVVAETQSSGRGRMGRPWVSPSGGLYFTVIFRPRINFEEATRIPLVAGVALVRAMERQASVSLRLKWPNDVMLGEQKVAGILSEMSGEMDRLDWMILGIGVNAATAHSCFPPEIRRTATSLAAESGRKVNRLQLLKDILGELESLLEEYRARGFEPFRAQWKERSGMMGRKVTITGGGRALEGKAVDIDTSGALVLDCAGGVRQRVIGGDMTFKEADHG